MSTYPTYRDIDKPVRINGTLNVKDDSLIEADLSVLGELIVGPESMNIVEEINAKLPLSGGTLTGDLTIKSSAPRLLIVPEDGNEEDGEVFIHEDETGDSGFKIKQASASKVLQVVGRESSQDTTLMSIHRTTGDISVTGNISLESGKTVDGVDISSLSSNFSSHSSNSEIHITSTERNKVLNLSSPDDASDYHHHDSIYNTKSEITSFLSGKSDLNHSHSNATTSNAGFMSATDKTKLDGISNNAEVNQNAWSTIKVGSTNINATEKQDTFELVAGTSILLSPDSNSKKVTINVHDIDLSNYWSKTDLSNSSTPGVNIHWNHLSSVPTAFTPLSHASTHASGGSDPITPASIGAQPAGTYAVRDTVQTISGQWTFSNGVIMTRNNGRAITVHPASAPADPNLILFEIKQQGGAGESVITMNYAGEIVAKKLTVDVLESSIVGETEGDFTVTGSLFVQESSRLGNNSLNDSTSVYGNFHVYNGVYDPETPNSDELVLEIDTNPVSGPYTMKFNGDIYEGNIKLSDKYQAVGSYALSSDLSNYVKRDGSLVMTDTLSITKASKTLTIGAGTTANQINHPDAIYLNEGNQKPVYIGKTTAKADLVVSGKITASNISAQQLTISVGNTSVTWTHNHGNTNYAVSVVPDTPARHIYYSNKNANTITFHIDDEFDETITLLATLIGW